MPEFIANKFCGNTDEMLLKTLLINSQTRTFSGKLALEIVRFRWSDFFRRTVCST